MQAAPSRRLSTQPAQPLAPPQLVWRCRSKRLSAPDKRAYEFLYAQTQGGAHAILITGADIGADQGTSSDAGRDRLVNLRDEGFIGCVEAARRGSYEVWLLDWRSALRALGQRDPQAVLPFFDDEPEAHDLPPQGNHADQALSESRLAAASGDAPSWSAKLRGAAGDLPPPHARIAAPEAEEPRRGTSASGEDPPEDPRRLAEEPPPNPTIIIGTIGSKKISLPPFIISKPSELSPMVNHSERLPAEEPRRGTSGGSSPGPSAAETDLLADVARRRQQLGIAAPTAPDPLAVQTQAAIHVAAAWRAPDPATQARWREQWIGVIRRRVGDPQLKLCVLAKVAAAIVAGEIPARDVEECLDRLDELRRTGELRVAAGLYFVICMKGGKRPGVFERHGLDWTGYAHGGRRAPKPK